MRTGGYKLTTVGLSMNRCQSSTVCHQHLEMWSGIHVHCYLVRLALSSGDIPPRRWGHGSVSGVIGAELRARELHVELIGTLFRPVSWSRVAYSTPNPLKWYKCS